MYNINLKTKRDNIDLFVDLIRNQFENAGINKYQLEGDKETVDLICEFVPGESGVDWILGEHLKRLARFKNNRQEKDLLKMAVEIYIIWLKMGFYLHTEHNEDLEHTFEKRKK